VVFVIHYSFDLWFTVVDVAFVLGSFCLGLGLEGCCLVNNTGTCDSISLISLPVLDCCRIPKRLRAFQRLCVWWCGVGLFAGSKHSGQPYLSPFWSSLLLSCGASKTRAPTTTVTVAGKLEAQQQNHAQLTPQTFPSPDLPPINSLRRNHCRRTPNNRPASGHSRRMLSGEQSAPTTGRSRTDRGENIAKQTFTSTRAALLSTRIRSSTSSTVLISVEAPMYSSSTMSTPLSATSPDERGLGRRGHCSRTIATSP